MLQNRTLYIGDNLDLMRQVPSESVKLIVTDPPFNKGYTFQGKAFSAAEDATFKDSWDWDADVDPQWLVFIAQAAPDAPKLLELVKSSHGDSTAAFLAWLAIRLLEMRRILTADGSVYIHCDHSIQAWLKCLMDIIWGVGNFRNEIIWQRHIGAKRTTRKFSMSHDTILFYAKSPSTQWNQETIPYTKEKWDATYGKWFRYHDPDGRLYKVIDLGAPFPGSGYLYNFLGTERYWRYNPERMNQLLADGRIHHKDCTPGANNTVAVAKRYADEVTGWHPTSLWTDIRPLHRQDKERTGYPTQKPIALYERMLTASSQPGDFVLDPFAGSGSSLIAAQKMKRQWAGMDLSESAYDIIVQRMEALSVYSEPVHYRGLVPPDRFYRRYVV